jgi:hypothetical protein
MENPMSIYEEIDVATARRAESNAKEDFTWAVTMWRMTGRERDKLQERIAELEGVAEHADFFPYLREMFDTHVELLIGRKAPTVAYVNDDGERAEFEVPDDFYGWLMGVRDSIPGQLAPSK